MLDSETKRRIDTARDILVGKVPDPKSQVEQITIALIYKFMDDMDAQSEELGGKRTFFTREFDKYGWAKLMAPSIGGDERIALYAEGMVKMMQNPGVPPLFRSIFKNAFLPYRDPETLKLFLKTINEFEYSHSEKLGDAFEYLLSVLGSQGEAGQFRTPRHIIDFIVEILDPKKSESVLDPACGTAGFLISAYKHILRVNSTPAAVEKTIGDGEATLYTSRIPMAKGDLLTPDERKKLADDFRGYDISPDMVRLSLVNMYLHGFTDPHVYEYDTLTSQDRWNEMADVILANPPFMSPKGGIKPHNRFSVQSKRSEVLFVDYIAEHLVPGGRAGVVVPDGVITGRGAANRAIRKLLIDRFCLDAVISLPAGVFLPYARAKTSILVFSRGKPREHVWMAQITADGFTMDERRKPCEENDIPGLLASWANRTQSERSFLVNTDEIRRRGYDLRIGRYMPLDEVDNSDHSLDVDGAITNIKSLAATSASLQSHKPWEGVTATARLGKHLMEVSRPINTKPSEQYRLLGVKWYGEGPFLRETVRGSEVSATKLFRVREGDIIYNRLFAWKGSFGVIPAELDGCFVSNEFPTFAIRDGSEVSPAFLRYFLKCPTVWGVAERLSTGTSSTSRNRLSEADFLDVPFPALTKQQQESYVAGILALDGLLQRTLAVEELSRAVLTKWITEFGIWVVQGWRNPPASENGEPSDDDDE